MVMNFFLPFVINVSLSVLKKSPSIWSCSLLLKSLDFNLVFQNQVKYLYSLISVEDVNFWYELKPRKNLELFWSKNISSLKSIKIFKNIHQVI
jgi:hypothetical protein